MSQVVTEPLAVPKKATPSRAAPRMLVLNLVAVVAGLGMWTLLSAIIGVAGLPGPVTVARRAGELIGDGTLAEDVLASLRRVIVGFALGTALAVPVGFLMGWYAVARGLLEPYIQFFRTIPPLAIIPLAIVLMGIGEVPKIFVIFLAAFLSSVVAAFQGVVDTDRTLINAARVLGASDRTIFVKVVVPASMPFILPPRTPDATIRVSANTVRGGLLGRGRRLDRPVRHRRLQRRQPPRDRPETRVLDRRGAHPGAEGLHQRTAADPGARRG